MSADIGRVENAELEMGSRTAAIEPGMGFWKPSCLSPGFMDGEQGSTKRDGSASQTLK